MIFERIFAGISIVSDNDCSWSATTDLLAQVMVRGGRATFQDFAQRTSHHSDHDLIGTNHGRQRPIPWS